jgi:hypothetical protein
MDMERFGRAKWRIGALTLPKPRRNVRYGVPVFDGKMDWLARKREILMIGGSNQSLRAELKDAKV